MVGGVTGPMFHDSKFRKVLVAGFRGSTGGEFPSATPSGVESGGRGQEKKRKTAPSLNTEFVFALERRAADKGIARERTDLLRFVYAFGVNITPIWGYAPGVGVVSNGNCVARYGGQ